MEVTKSLKQESRHFSDERFKYKLKLYKDENGRWQCAENCGCCDRDRKTCEAHKERVRAVRRDIYRARKERRKAEMM